MRQIYSIPDENLTSHRKTILLIRQLTVSFLSVTSLLMARIHSIYSGHPPNYGARFYSLEFIFFRHVLWDVTAQSFALPNQCSLLSVTSINHDNLFLSLPTTGGSVLTKCDLLNSNSNVYLLKIITKYRHKCLKKSCIPSVNLEKKIDEMTLILLAPTRQPQLILIYHFFWKYRDVFHSRC